MDVQEATKNQSVMHITFTLYMPDIYNLKQIFDVNIL